MDSPTSQLPSIHHVSSDSNTSESSLSNQHIPTQQQSVQTTLISDGTAQNSNNGNGGVQIKRLTSTQRHHIIECLVANLKNGKPARGTMSKTAQEFGVTRRTITNLWQIAKKQLEDRVLINVKTRFAGKVGRKRTEVDLSKLTDIPLRRRTNIRSLAKALGVSKSTVHRLIQAGEIHSHSNAIKPHLTNENTLQRLAFVLSKLQPTNNVESHTKFNDMTNVIHIDEKWFYMSNMTQRYYLHKNEVEPHRTCKSKRFITKIMFLAVVCQPRFDEDGNCIFDGKIGIFPFIVVEPAKRKSKNREAGDLEYKPINSITKEVIKKCLIEQVIPAIKSKWPLFVDRVIYIQQDNARPHLSPDDPDFQRVATSDGFDIRLTYQPSNSPDLNVLDLGFFNAIQTLQHEYAPRNVVELVDAVVNAFNELQPRTLSNVWLTLQNCMVEILKCKGTNAYTIPHIGKARMLREGTLPTQVDVDATIVQDAKEHLNGTTPSIPLHM